MTASVFDVLAWIVANPPPVEADAARSIQIADVRRLDTRLTQPGFPSPEAPLVLTNLGSPEGSARAGHFLAQWYPVAHRAWYALAESPTPAWTPVPATQLASVANLNGDVVAFVPPLDVLALGGALRTLEDVTRRLRAPDGCPWDREQTHASIKRNLLEETYELLEAFDEGDVSKCREELGDMLMQVFLHAQMGKEAGEYDLGTVTSGIVDKLIRRHPHVFGDVRVGGVADVLQNWDAIKEGEGKHDRSPLAGIPATMPALAYAQGVQERAARTGFAWPDSTGVWSKLEEELLELRAATTGEEAGLELGDVLFVLANLARYLDVQAEEALRGATRRFRTRFEKVVRLARDGDQSLRDLPIDRLEHLA